MIGVRIGRNLVIPAREIDITFSTSGGPGGQHANKTATRVDLTWNVATSQALGPRQRQRLMEVLKRRLDASGTLRISSDRYRSQARNREDAVDRLRELVTASLRTPKQRVSTSATAGSKQQRLKTKRIHSQKKALRQKPRSLE